MLLAPLADCAFNRSKSNIKWLEASAFRGPVSPGQRLEPYERLHRLDVPVRPRSWIR